MARQGISTGTVPNDGTGDTLAGGAIKINQNFSEIYSFLGDGTNLNSVKVNDLSLAGITTGLNVSGISTVGFLTVSQLYVSGITTLGQTNTTGLSNSGVSTLGNATASTLVVSGFSTLGSVSASNLTLAGITTGLNVPGISTLGFVQHTTLNVSGVSTFSGGLNASQGADLARLRVTGISTLGQTNTTGFSNAGVSTLGNATASTLVISGFSTLGSVSGVNLTLAGITTGLNVPGISTLGFVQHTTLNVSGISTVGFITASQLYVSGISTITQAILSAGTNTVAPLKFTSGTNLTSAVAGAVEYDGTYFYTTPETTSGRGYLPSERIFRLTSNGSAIGPTIADYFALGAISLNASSVYDVEIHAYFTKTTAGTATWTLTASSAPTAISGYYIANPITGIAAGAITSGYAGSQASTTAAFSATGSLTTAVNHSFIFKVQIITNAATTFKLQLTQSAGTATPLAGSYYTVKRISGTTGSFS